MKLNIYSIYDEDLEEYSALILYKSNRLALSAFDKMMSEYAKNPRLKDSVFYLHKLGEFDTDSGIITVSKSEILDTYPKESTDE